MGTFGRSSLISMTFYSALLVCVLAPVLVVARSSNIVNGDNASAGEFPWQASFQTRGGWHFCGASIISDRWLVTAAHCIGSKGPSAMKVVLGLHNKLFPGNAEAYAIERIIVHPKWDRSGLNNDITLLKTKEAIKMGDAVSTIKLPSQDEDFSGKVCQISGWGEIGWNKGGSNVLQKLDVEIKSKSYCGNYYQTPDKVCIRPANNRASSACRGDSGGPLACDGVLVGAASYVYGQCNTRYPNVYANVANFRDWITE